MQIGLAKKFRPQAASMKDPTMTLPLGDLVKELNTRITGLSDEEADLRLSFYGPNEYPRKKVVPVWIRFLRLFIQPLVLILMMAAVISAFLGEPSGAIIIGAMVVLSVTLEFTQEYRSERTAEKLAVQVALTSAVVRDGVEAEIPVVDIVPGDLIRLGVGDIVPADCRLLSAKDFFVHQAALTGEPYPVEKAPSDTPKSDDSLADMDYAVFYGTNVISGTAEAIVVGTGGNTEFGRMAKSLGHERPETEFQRGIREFTNLLVRVIAFLVVGIFLLNLFQAHGFLESLLFAVAVSVGITPELLPMIITINLSTGAAAMAKRKVIVKRLHSIQNLGSMDLLCTDKTGTLTEGKLVLYNHVDVTGNDSAEAFRLAYLNSAFQASMKNPMDLAVVAHGKFGTDGYIKVDEVPFDFTRRLMTVVVCKDGARTMITKGAPEGLMERCTKAAVQGRIVEIDDQLKAEAAATFRSLSNDGYRSLGVAFRELGKDEKEVYETSDEKDLTFVGFVSFIDPPKESAKESILELERLGIDVKILTGDNELVTAKICERVGITVKGVLMGGEIAKLSGAELHDRVLGSTICARLSPDQKEHIIKALKEAGHVVGYMGDGINDMMPLRNADVGISVNNAVDVAKEAADIVLLEEGLHILKEGILEGRRTFANTMKYIMMGTSSNFGNMFSVPAALFLVPFLPMLPVQILLNNLLYDFSQVSIPTDNVDEDYLQRPKRWDIGFIKRFMLIFGPISSLYDITTYLVMIYVFKAGESLFQTGWFIESLATQTLVIHVIRSRHSIFKSRASKVLMATTALGIAAGLMVVYSPLGSFFNFTPPPARFFLILSAMIAAYLLMVEAVKRWFYSRYGQR